MIDFADYEQFSEALGVPLDQVRRDHLISHVLGALSTEGGFVFFGGTALNRTLLTGRRLSEDIDLYATENDADWVGVLNRVSLFVRRGFGATVASRLHRTGDVTTYSIAGGNLAIRLQTVGYRYEYSLLPVARSPVALWYPDLPETVTFHVPTAAAFVAMKLAAYADRGTPRDLFDLDGLVGSVGISPEALSLHKALMGHLPLPTSLEHAPSAEAWQAELAHQVSDPGDAGSARQRCHAALVRALELHGST